jgi:hypothetical protein
MIFAVFLAMDAAQEHVHCRLSEVWCRREETWSSLPFFQSTAMETHGLAEKMIAKMPKNDRNCESSLSSFKLE